MTTGEALRLVAMLTAYFNRELSNETAALWARDLVEFEVIDGMESAHVLGVSGRFMPSLSEFLDAIKDARNERLRNAMKPLAEGGPRTSISFREWLRTMATEREREAVKRMGLGRLLEADA